MEWDSSQVVFLGRVTSIQNTKSVGKAVRFVVKENFRGNSNAEHEMVIYTGAGGGDCGYPFVEGFDYLVYASSRESLLSTSICSGTKPEVMVGGLLRELRAAEEGRRFDDLFGTVGVGPNGAGFGDQVEVRPLAGVIVRAVGSDGSEFSTKTDTSGAYFIQSLKTDVYRVEMDFPAGLSSWEGRQGTPITVTVNNKDSVAQGCRVDAFPPGRIAGKVVDTDGKGVAGFVTLQPVDPNEAAVAMRRGGLVGDDTVDGNFTLSPLPPGHYRLIFSPRDRSNPKCVTPQFWPPQGSNSNGIELGFGQHVDDIRFVVTMPE
jgi:hypothetical protein